MISRAIERAVGSSALHTVLEKLSFSLFFQEESGSTAQNWLLMLWQIVSLLRTQKTGGCRKSVLMLNVQILIGVLQYLQRQREN